jgi:hypothetical protein
MRAGYGALAAVRAGQDHSSFCLLGIASTITASQLKYGGRIPDCPFWGGLFTWEHRRGRSAEQVVFFHRAALARILQFLSARSPISGRTYPKRARLLWGQSGKPHEGDPCRWPQMSLPHA